MQNDMMKYFREDLQRRMLSTDFKKQVDGIEMLQKVFCYEMPSFNFTAHFEMSCLQTSMNFQALASIGKDVIEVLDILLRWFVLQFCKSNTTCLLKVWI